MAKKKAPTVRTAGARYVYGYIITKPFSLKLSTTTTKCYYKLTFSFLAFALQR